MSWEQIITIGTTVFTIISAPVLYIWRTTVHRIDNLEKEQVTKVDRAEVKELINERLDPVHEDLNEIKNRIESLINYIITK